MNEALLSKWTWRILKDDPDDLCCRLLKAKYYTATPFVEIKRKRGSQFWQGILKVAHKAKWGITFQVNDGRKTLFWEDTWLLDIPLKLAYPKMYRYSWREMRAVYRFYKEGVWDLDLTVLWTKMNIMNGLISWSSLRRYNCRTTQIKSNGCMRNQAFFPPDQCIDL
jgi:hypothetical protein